MNQQDGQPKPEPGTQPEPGAKRKRGRPKGTGHPIGPIGQPAPQRVVVRTSKAARRVLTIDYFSPEEACGILGITYQTIIRWIRTKKIKAARFGRQWRIPARELLPDWEQPKPPKRPRGRPRKVRTDG